MRTQRIALASALFAALAAAYPSAQDRPAPVTARRLAQNPLVTHQVVAIARRQRQRARRSSACPNGSNQPLGRYYMYFAHHMGAFIRLAYADRIEGPWRIHEPGVLPVASTAFYRPSARSAGESRELLHPRRFTRGLRRPHEPSSGHVVPRLVHRGPEMAGRRAGGTRLGAEERLRSVHPGGRIARRPRLRRPAGDHPHELSARVRARRAQGCLVPGARACTAWRGSG